MWPGDGSAADREQGPLRGPAVAVQGLRDALLVPGELTGAEGRPVRGGIDAVRLAELVQAASRTAVLDLVSESGIAGVTMEAVAARAATSKPVLYRRWPDRAALLRDTLLPLAVQAIPAPDTGGYRADMLAVLNGWRRFFASSHGAIGPAIVGAMPHDPELADAFRHGVIGWRKQARAGIITRGIARGEVRPDIRIDVARELGQASKDPHGHADRRARRLRHPGRNFQGVGDSAFLVTVRDCPTPVTTDMSRRAS